MKHKHLPSRLLSVLLVFALLCGFAVPAAAVEGTETEISFRQVDNSKVSANEREPAADEEATQPEYEDTDTVRVSIFLKEESTVAAGYPTKGIASNAAAKVYREKLRAAQDALTVSIERVTGEKLDVVWNLTLATNAISANVEYGQIAAIEQLPDVEKVILETRYEPQQSVTSAVNEPNMVISSQMTGTNVAWQSGYTGAGMRIAIIDTGLDLDHQSVDPEALAVALKEDAAQAGLSYDEYLTQIDLLDEEEIAQVLPQLNASERYDGLTAQDLYVNLKAPFGFNYVDASLELTHDNDTEGGHGSHVAGIAAANRYIKQNGEYVSAADSVYMVGNAPDAQIIVMKVFGQNGGAYESDYMVAIEDAILLGCDSVNLSLGSSSAGEPHDETYDGLLASLAGTDTVVITSMGNSGRWADNAECGNLYLDDVNTLTGGAPGTYANSFAVASVDNDGIVSNCFTVSGGDQIYLEDTTYGNAPFVTLDTSEDGSGTEYDYVMIESAGDYGDFDGIDMTGKIAICSRGEIELYRKAVNAVKAGAIATILCNNEPGVFYADLYYYGKWYGYKQPCVSSTLAAAEYIRANGEQHTTEDGKVYYTGKITVSGKYTADKYDTNTYTMSDFSSWGVPGDLTLKPEITAPGGNVFSLNGETAETDQYFLMSGTSMAAPQISGITALVKQYIEVNGLGQDGVTDRALAQSVLMSTATPLKDADGQYYPLLQQGAGLANAAAATGFDSYILVDGQPDGKVKAELGDDPERTGVYTFRFDIHNVTDEAKSYELSADVFTQGFYEDYANESAVYYERENQRCLYMDTQTAPLSAGTLWTVDGCVVSAAGELALCDFNGDGTVDEADGQALLDYVTGACESIQAADRADMDLDGDVDTYDVYLFLSKLGAQTVTVPAGGSVQVSVTIRLTDAAKALLDEYYTNGAYIQAYVYANAIADEEGVVGTSHSIPMLAFYGNWSDPSMFDHGIQQTYNTREQGYAAEGEDSRVPYLHLTDLYKANVNTFMMTYVADPYNSYMLGGNPVVTDTRYMPERNAINSENGDYVSKIKATIIRNAAASRYTVTNTDTGEVLKESDLGMIYASYFYGLAYDPVAYTLPGSWNPEGLPEGTHLELALTLAPDYYVNDDGSVRWDELGRGTTLKTPVVIDNTAPVVESITLDVLHNTLNVTASDNQFVSAVSLYNASGEQRKAQTGSNPDAKIGETCTFVLDVSEVDGQKFLVQVTDYAMNAVTYEIEVDLGDIAVPDRIAFDLTYGYWVGYNQSSKWPLPEWMPSSETFYAGVWLDHILLASTDEGKLYVMPENDPSDKNYVGKMDVVLTDMAYNAADGEVYGVAENKLYTVNRLNGAVTEIGEIGITTNTLACDANGTFYSQKLETGEIYSYTRSTLSEPTLLVEIPKMPSISVQGMEIDPNTGMLCWNTYRVEYYGDWVVTYGVYFEIDPATGEYKRIVDLWDNLACLMIPEKSGGDWMDPVDTVDGVEISRDTLELLPGSTGKLSATVTPWTATDRTVTWSTSDASVATVNEEGVVTGASEGVCTITATSNLDANFSASCTVTVSTVKTTLKGILMDPNEQTKLFTWNTEDESGWKAGNDLSIGLISATLDTDRNQLVVLDSYCNSHTVDPETGELLHSAEVTLGLPLGDMAYSTVFSTEDTPMVSSIYGSIFLTPQNPLEPTGLGFDMSSRLSLAGATELAALTSLGYEQYYVEATGTLVDAEHLVLLDDVGNVWNMWLYDNGKGGMSAMVDYYPSTMRVLDFPGISGLLFCSMVVGEDGCLYVSYFDGDTCRMYRLSFDPMEKMYMADLLGELGDGVWPASLYAAESNVKPDAVVGFAPTGKEVELQSTDNSAVLLIAASETEKAPTGKLNAVTGQVSQRRTAKPESDCKDNTVTLTITADTETTNGLYTVSYDASKLTLTNKSSGCALSSFTETDGQITFGFAGKTALPKDSVLATLTFKVKDGSDAAFTVTKAQENAAHPATAENVTLAITGHSWGEWVTTEAADCFRDGLMTRTCTACGATETKTVPANSDNCPSKAFTDLDTSAWYHEGVDYALENGLMNGTGAGIFEPDANVTRAMIVTVLYRMEGEPEVKTAAPFVDVPENAYYAKAVAWAYENKIVLGVTADRFAPDAVATREQLVTLLYRYAEYIGADMTAQGSLDAFKDKNDVSEYARNAMAWAVGAGLLKGDNGRLLPEDASTRAQFATILSRFSEN